MSATNAELEAGEMMRCASCGVAGGDDIKLKKCDCKLVKYCSVKCQRDHRPKHKKECKKRAAELRDEILFKQPESSSYLGDCPICYLPLSIDVKKSSTAFGGDMKKLLPPMSEIPEEFKNGRGKWSDFFGKWYFSGLPKTTQMRPKEGVETSKAISHIRAVMASWEPSHEHKEAGCAFLLSEFFDDYSYEGFES